MVMLMAWINCLAIFSLFSGKPANPHSATIKQVLRQYSQEVKKENNASVIASGSRLEIDGTEQWSYDFVQSERVTLAEARRIYVPLIQKLVHMVNNDPKMQSFLKDKPFTSHNTDIGLLFWDTNGHYICKPYIAYVKLINGRIGYAVNSDRSSPLESIYKEPYEEAVRIVQEEERLKVQAANQ